MKVGHNIHKTGVVIAMKRLLADMFLLAAIALAANGCAFHFYDKDTGTEHLWGFGHFRMKAPPKTGARPVVTGTHMLGLNLRAGRDNYGVGVGYDSQSRITMPADGGTLLLEWPANFPGLPREMRDLFNVRVGTNLPPDMEPNFVRETATNLNAP